MNRLQLIVGLLLTNRNMVCVNSKIYSVKNISFVGAGRGLPVMVLENGDETLTLHKEHFIESEVVDDGLVIDIKGLTFKLSPTSDADCFKKRYLFELNKKKNFAASSRLDGITDISSEDNRTWHDISELYH